MCRCYIPNHKGMWRLPLAPPNADEPPEDQVTAFATVEIAAEMVKDRCKSNRCFDK